MSQLCCLIGSYIDLQYFLWQQLTTTSDVYGFCVVLLELITGFGVFIMLLIHFFPAKCPKNSKNNEVIWIVLPPN